MCQLWCGLVGCVWFGELCVVWRVVCGWVSCGVVWVVVWLSGLWCGLVGCVWFGGGGGV